MEEANDDGLGSIRRRLAAAQEQLSELGLAPNVYLELIPYVLWLDESVVVEPSAPARYELLEKVLGPRFAEWGCPKRC